jgi:geranylgeranyl diphosphate synthase type II
MIEQYLAEARNLVLAEIQAQLPKDTRHTGGLYALMLEYPLRAAKALRPALCMATCRMLGGTLPSVLPTAAALELYHNAFLIHDDVEDGSELRRNKPTLARENGVPIAINVGDGMLALAMRPLLDNTRLIGLQRSMAVLEAICEMARISAEGQAMELAWIHKQDWSVQERDYLRMVYKKTSCYSFVTPARCGMAVAGQNRPGILTAAGLLGIAFQIQDDVLNLSSGERYGKEAAGDLWEGKHTLILIHALKHASSSKQSHARAILSKPRSDKNIDDIAFLQSLIAEQNSLAFAREQALQHALRARRSFQELALLPSNHADFFEALLDYVVKRDW